MESGAAGFTVGGAVKSIHSVCSLLTCWLVHKVGCEGWCRALFEQDKIPASEGGLCSLNSRIFLLFVFNEIRLYFDLQREN